MTLAPAFLDGIGFSEMLLIGFIKGLARRTETKAEVQPAQNPNS